jgi:peptidoglycan L-alanyl-D-glutamate endopeptidase CwlK
VYKLGTRSQAELIGVHPDGVAVVERAITITAQDFSVFDGLRTAAEQAEYVRTGVSKTLKSKHLKQPDGFGHAVDLVPYINGKLRWEMAPILIIAEAVHEAATDLDVPLRWGAIWDLPFLDLDRTSLEAQVEAYIARRQAAGRKPFIDGPHFELKLT